jgi:hypothetical protein
MTNKKRRTDCAEVALGPGTCGIFCGPNTRPMIFRLVAALSAIGIALFAGCASAPRPAQATEPAGEPVREIGTATDATGSTGTAGVAQEPATALHKKPSPAGAKPAAPTGFTLQPGEYALLVTSDQPGATVVVNGKPLGRTPCSVIVQANTRGFLRDRVSIKVRFIASDESGVSQTVEDVLTTLDRVPTEIRFSAAGSTRVVR